MKPPLTAEEIFTKEPIKNFMTPHVLSRVLIGPGIAAELSEGLDIMDNPLFTVTVAIVLPSGRIFRASLEKDKPVRAGIFKTREAAEQHIADMAEYIRAKKKETP